MTVKTSPEKNLKFCIRGMDFYRGDDGRFYPFQLEENLGEYTTKIDGLNSRLNLKTRLFSFDYCHYGQDLYIARFVFSGDFEKKDCDLVSDPKITLEIEGLNLGGIFERVLRSAESIGVFLSQTKDWLSTRTALRSILSLEEQTKKLEEERKKASKERVRKLLDAREIAIQEGDDRIAY